MVTQVRLVEVVTLPSQEFDRTVFAFGSHPDAAAEEQHAVTAAKASPNKLRIVVDELLRGNNLEEIRCRFPVDDDVYGRVPLGATPDDIARCAGAQDVLPRRCPGSNQLSVCLCDREAGCPSGFNGDGSANITPPGESVGVADLDRDGAADDSRFVLGAVAIACGADTVPTDLDQSYWTPSGTQQKPAQGGFDALGPAIVLVPSGAMPTSAECSLAFSPDVVDKDGNAVCAPPDGDLAAGCSPGDTSAIKFTTEPLKFLRASTIIDPGQSRINDVVIRANVALDVDSLAGITVTEDPATNYTDFVATLTAAEGSLKLITIRWTAVGGLAPNTRYTITVPTTVTDAYGKSAPQPFQLAFTTGAT